MSDTIVQLIQAGAIIFGSGGAVVAFRTAGSQARKQRNEGGEVYVKASDGAVVTMQRILDELEQDRNYWRTRARETEEELSVERSRVRVLERLLRAKP
jgi:hypothetical protein